ncbi:hypothetical protein P3T76_010437 [Phytophthora citrophthora]|uniref:Uncharacterized protein n=1 Tax=Phytophthora citrophthora TaxID=4793 RepID=A0AAD9GCC0_9STRA|nr:hypothetical protein P3T76_010437 [Phytophthora citrophthora]
MAATLLLPEVLGAAAEEPRNMTAAKKAAILIFMVLGIQDLDACSPRKLDNEPHVHSRRLKDSSTLKGTH